MKKFLIILLLLVMPAIVLPGEPDYKIGPLLHRTMAAMITGFTAWHQERQGHRY